MTYIVMDNHVYGMTKGQASPTTEPDWDNKLSPGAPASLVPPAGDRARRRRASFVARAFSGDPNGTADIIARASATRLRVHRDPLAVRDVPA